MSDLLAKAKPSMTALLVLAVVLVGGIGALWLQRHGSAQVRVVVLTHRVPEFHVLAASDVRLADVARADLPPDAITSLDQAVDKFTLTELSSHGAIGKDDLGPTAPCCARLSVLPLTVDDAAAAHVRRGDLLQLALSPTGEGTPTVIVPNVLVVDLADATDDTTTLRLAVPAARIPHVVAVIARSEPLLLTPTE